MQQGIRTLKQICNAAMIALCPHQV